jgi:NAD+ synthase (glutamine-hydrolysing)
MGALVAAAQLNLTVGDFDGNADRIVQAAAVAAEQGAHVLLTPELSLAGYPPEDLLLRHSFYVRSDEALRRIIEASRAWPTLTIIVGHPIQVDASEQASANHFERFNAASVIRDGVVQGLYCKHQLPNYDVFDEQRYFRSGQSPLVFEINGTRFGLVICEDFWFRYPAERAHAAGAQVVLALNASPYHMNKQHVRIDRARANVSRLGMAFVAANLVGGQDELVFDGDTFALDGSGQLVAQAKSFDEDLLFVEFDGARPLPARIEKPLPLEQQVYMALRQGVRDYLGKNGFPGAIIGLSGGIDSALVLAVAVDALGADRVRAVMMPSQYTADISWIDARDMAKRLAVRYDELPIRPVFEQFRQTLAQEFRGLPEDATEENIQARVRGTLLMALSNKHGAIVLTTGNKSEMAVGYCTLYGDMAGGFAVIKDIAKTLVYRLARWRNTVSDVIPDRIITRAPSAELRPNQTDQDSLPPYDVLDGIMKLYMEDNRSTRDIVAAGYAPEEVARVVRLIRINEYKRRQAPVGIRVTSRAFGRDWRYPITSRYRD